MSANTFIHYFFKESDNVALGTHSPRSVASRSIASWADRTRTGGRRGGLLVDLAVRLFDLAVRQNLLQFGDARIGYLGVDEIELLQVG